MLLDGHTASSIAKRLGLSNASLLYQWKQEQLAQSPGAPGVAFFPVIAVVL